MLEKKRRYVFVLIALITLSIASIHVADGAPTRTPSQPRDLIGSPRDSSVILEWKEPGTGSIGLTQYNIYRATSGKPLEKLIVSPDIHTFTDRSLENGVEYNYYITAENAIGEGSASNFVQIIPDGDIPMVTINTPVDGTVYFDGTIRISWTGSDITSDIKEYHIRIRSDRWIMVGLDTEYELNDPNRGDNLIEVRATDIAMNRGIDSVTIIMDDKAPTVVIRSPKDHEILKDKNITVEWDTYELESSIAGYEVFLDGKYTGYRGEGENYTIKNLKDGTYRIEVHAYDIVGNSGRDSINITVDTNGPLLYIYEPIMGQITNETIVRMNWTGDDRSGISYYSIYHDDMGWIDQGRNSEALIGPFPEGMNLIQIKAEDNVGWSTVKERTIMVDLTEPVVDIEYPVEGERYSVHSIDVMWNGSDELSGIDSFFIKHNDEEWVKDTNLKDRINNLVSGTYVVSIKAVDRAGNERIETVMFYIDNVPPQVTDYGPIGSNIQVPERIWMNFNEDMIDVEISVPDLTGRQKMIDGVYTWTPDERFEFGESYLVMVVGSDLSGNEIEYFAWTFTITDQVMVRGAVYDDDGDPIREARIILDTGKTTLTASDGSFNFTVRMGNRTILVKRSGYETKEIQLNLTPDRTGYVGNIYLEKGHQPIGKRVTSVLLDPWTLIVLTLVLVVFGLIGFLFKDPIVRSINKFRSKGEIEVRSKHH